MSASVARRRGTALLAWVGVLLLLGMLMHLAAAPAADLGRAAPAATQHHPSVAASPSGPAGARPGLSALASAAECVDPPGDPGFCEQETARKVATASENYLPSSRWAWASTNLWSDVGAVSDFLTTFRNGLSSLMFTFAGLIWVILVTVLRWGITADFIDVMAAPINKGVVAIFLTLAPFTGIVLLLAAIKVVRGRGRGGGAGSFRSIGAFLLFFSMMFGITQASSAAVEQDQPFKVGTLPWLARTVDGLTGSLVAEASKAALMLGGGGGAQQAVTEGNEPSCEAYVAELYKRFEAGTEGIGGVSTLMTVDHLWQRSYLSLWQRAQYGTTGFPFDPGGRLYCHQLEIAAGVPVAEQVDIATAAYADQGIKFAGPSAQKGAKPSVFGPFPFEMDSASARAAILTWVACDSTGGGQFAQGSGLRLMVEITPETDCAGAFAGTSGIDKNFDFSDTAVINRAVDAGRERAAGDPERLAEVANMETMLRSMSGYGSMGTDRMIAGVAAIATAAVYLVVLGAIALGGLMTQVALVLLLILLPFTLAAAALGVERGTKLLRLTGASMFVHALFGLLLVIMTSLIFLVQQMIVGVFNS